jgi:hypothetical protein
LATNGFANAAAPLPLTPGTQSAIVDSVSALLRARYVDSTLAVRIDRHLHERLASGAYAKSADPKFFAQTLTSDMASIVQDQHLRVSYEPERQFVGADSGVMRRGPAPNAGPAGSGPGGGAPMMMRRMAGPGTNGVVRTNRIDGRDSLTIARTNFGFESVQRLPGNVGYLKLNQFVPLDYSQATATTAMAFLASVDAMIVDLRDNIGGSPDLVRQLLSYFYPPEPVLLYESVNRGADIRDSGWSLKEIPGLRLQDVELYVLTSPTTASAAEMFAYAAQWTKRATLVGARTSGAGNGGLKTSVGGGLALFTPEWRVTTGPGWEGTGVQPDVAVAPREARDRAHVMALEKLIARAEGERRRGLELALELTKASADPKLATIDVQQYVGEYAGAQGTRRVWAEGADLYMSITGWRTKLTPLSTDMFRAGASARLKFHRDAAGRVNRVDVEPLDGGETMVESRRS